METILIIAISVCASTALSVLICKLWEKSPNYKVSKVPQSLKKARRLDKVMDLFNSLEQIDNLELQTLLGISSSTASRYLRRLKFQGKIRQIGKTGVDVFYIKT